MTDSVIWFYKMVRLTLRESLHITAKTPILQRSGINLSNSYWWYSQLYPITLVTLDNFFLHLWIQLETIYEAAFLSIMLLLNICPSMTVAINLLHIVFTFSWGLFTTKTKDLIMCP
jgi:hypothetical protein